MLDIDLLDDELTVPELREPETFDELMEQIAIISESIGRCEKILQHLAVGGWGTDMDTFITKHINLIAMKNRLYTKLKKSHSKKAKAYIKSLM